MKDLLLTKEGLGKLEHELEHLKNVRRPAVIKRLQAAKELGDLSENSEYDDARNEQSFVEGRIEEVEAMLKRAKLVDKTNNEMVEIGNAVTVDIDGARETYEIVGAAESDPSNGKISADSPIGRALLEKKVGESASAQTPGGELKFKVIKIA